MRVNIKDSIIEKLQKEETALQLKKLVEDFDYEEYNFKSQDEMENTIMTDLMVDGRFITIDGKWDLKEKYTIKDILKNQRLELAGMIEEEKIEEVEDIEEEIKALSTDDEEVESIDSFLNLDSLDGDEDEN